MLNSIEQSIKEKIEKYGTPLSKWNISINYGIKTGYNDAFIISGEVKDKLIAEDPKSAELIRPILRGRDIKRYSYDFADLWLIYVPWHFPLENDENIVGVSEKAEKLFQTTYPAIYNHLLMYKEQLSKRNTAETGIRYEWYALQRWGAKYRDDFNKQKIIYPCIMSKESAFIFDENGEFFTVAPGNIITGENLKYLLACLNSKIYYFALRKYYMGGGIEGELKTNRLLILPIMLPDINNYAKQLNSLVSGNSIEKQNENQIEELIAAALNLTLEEHDYIKKASI